MPGKVADFQQGVYGIGLRDPYESELQYFKANPYVGGMAAEDDKIILNPYSPLKQQEKEAVMRNEAARVHMRSGLMPRPNYDLTPEQTETFKSYGTGDVNDIRQTIAARIFSGDPSALNSTEAQKAYVDQLRQFMGIK